MNFKKLTREQLILLIQLILKKMGKKRTFDGLRKPKHIVVHHSASNANFAQVNAYHKQRWGFKSSLGYYAGYHYFIEKDGKLTQARKDTEEAAHTAEAGNPHYWNRNSIGICLQGNFENEKPTKAQTDKLWQLLRAKQIQYNGFGFKIPNTEIYGHKDISPTLCPGKHLYLWLQEYKGRN